jgi:hypothetical protein
MGRYLSISRLHSVFSGRPVGFFVSLICYLF